MGISRIGITVYDLIVDKSGVGLSTRYDITVKRTPTPISKLSRSISSTWMPSSRKRAGKICL